MFYVQFLLGAISQSFELEWTLVIQGNGDGYGGMVFAEMRGQKVRDRDQMDVGVCGEPSAKKMSQFSIAYQNNIIPLGHVHRHSNKRGQLFNIDILSAGYCGINT